MPANAPMTVPVDPHLLAQWRFDERRRSDEGRDASSHGATVVLGRWPDRIEFRSRAEVPGVAESARAIAAVTEGPAYRAQLLEIAGRILQSTGVGETAAEAATAAAEPSPEAPSPAADAVPAADDWLARLDATIATAPHAEPHPEPRDATYVAPQEPAATASTELPDFLFADGDGRDEPEAAAAEPEDDAFYLPPVEGSVPSAPLETFDVPPRAPLAGVPVLDFVVEPDDVPPVASTIEVPGEPEPEPAAAAGDPEPEPWAADPLPVHSTGDEVAAEAEEPAVAAADPVPQAAPEPESEPEPELRPEPAPAPAAVMPPPLPPQAAAASPVAAPAPQRPAASSADGAGIRGRLVSLGAEMGMQVWGAAAGGAAAAPAGLGDALRRQLAAMDVVWQQDGAVAAAFLVAPASATEGMLTVSDVLAVAAGVPIPVYLVGDDSARDELRAAAARPTFARTTPPLADACQFIGVEVLERALAGVSAFLRYLRPEFIEALAERL